MMIEVTQMSNRVRYQRCYMMGDLIIPSNAMNQLCLVYSARTVFALGILNACCFVFYFHYEPII